MRVVIVLSFFAGGGLFFVPVDSVVPAEMSVEGLMSVYVSMGATTSKFVPVQKIVAPKAAL